MKMKSLTQTILAVLTMAVGLSAQAHEGHAPAGVVHELHHVLWIVMAAAVSGVCIYLLNKRRKSKNETHE